jgi:hypothetical protein
MCSRSQAAGWVSKGALRFWAVEAVEKKETDRTARSTKRAEKITAAEQKSPVDRTAELYDEVLKAVEAGQPAAIEAVRRFVDTVDEVLPALGERPSRRETIIDAALDMANRLVTTPYNFIRNVVRSPDRSLTMPGAAKKQTTARTKRQFGPARPAARGPSPAVIASVQCQSTLGALERVNLEHLDDAIPQRLTVGVLEDDPVSLLAADHRQTM